MNLGEGKTQCFWLDPTGLARLSLRRFTFSVGETSGAIDGHRDCPAQPGGCDATVETDVEFEPVVNTDDDGWVSRGSVPYEFQVDASDPRWPKDCEHCGLPFADTDEWQVNQVDVYVRGDTGERIAFRGYQDVAMAGALFDCWWLKGRAGQTQARARGGPNGKQDCTGPDGIALVAICPNGAQWMIDGPATGGGGWTRTGDPRKPETLSVSPSIIAGDYHGFLGSGGTEPGWFSAHIG